MNLGALVKEKKRKKEIKRKGGNMSSFEKTEICHFVHLLLLF